ncbi:hypothetical protein [Pantoea ananatis]|uniref:hypothetical protein n=1 Tax=Pantoea ananas TaxID=553 RepID=UPI0011A5BC6B|nr:hypothetical protein [Pantoea ananatis]
MTMTHSDKKTQKQYVVTEVFTRMGVAMEDLLRAAPKMLKDGKFEGNELHGRSKQRRKAA